MNLYDRNIDISFMYADDDAHGSIIIDSNGMVKDKTHPKVRVSLPYMNIPKRAIYGKNSFIITPADTSAKTNMLIK